MVETTVIVQHREGLHARLAARLVQTANQFEQTVIRIGKDAREVNAKSIVGVLTLGIGQGAEVRLCAEGAEAEQALAALETLIRSNFGEEL